MQDIFTYRKNGYDREERAACKKTNGRIKKIRAIAITILSIIVVLLAISFDPVLEPEAEAATSTDAPGIFAGGSGTAADPYLIENSDQMQAFRDSVNAGNAYDGVTIALSSDVDITGIQWTPIGASTRSGAGVTSASTPFKGTFDGRAHTITGLTITPQAGSATQADYALGLFGAVLGGTVENLVLEDVSIDAPDSELAGGAVGLLSDGGTVSGIRTSGSVKAKCGTGGIVGRMTASGSIKDCTNSASVQVTGGSGNCGGIVGAAYYTPIGSRMAITGCTNKGAVTGVNDTGGIAGLCCAFVSSCKNEGKITGSGFSVGGIAGEMKNYGGVSNCNNIADVSNVSDASPYGTGGIVGWLRYDGAPPAYALSAPISVTGNMNSGSVGANTGTGAGGIVGILYSAGTVTGNENSAPSINGSNFVAGIVGGLQRQDTGFPDSMTVGASVINNVSSTPATDIHGSFTNLYAYNNDASIFTVKDNSPHWEARDASTGSLRYATLEQAVSHAANGDTVTLLSDVNDAGMLEPQSGRDVTLDLAGHDIAFSPDGGITAKGEDFTVVGKGDVYALDPNGTIASSPKLFTEATGDDGIVGKIILKGGTYPEDVSEYVASGYESAALGEPNSHENHYEVIQAKTPDDPDRPDDTTDLVLPGEGEQDPTKVAEADKNGASIEGDPTAKTGDSAAFVLLVISGVAAMAGVALIISGSRIRAHRVDLG